MVLNLQIIHTRACARKGNIPHTSIPFDCSTRVEQSIHADFIIRFTGGFFSFFTPLGEEIRWEPLDADLHISSFFDTKEPNYNNEVAALFARFPWLNIAEVAKAMNVHPSLIARYIYGMATPTPQRLSQLRTSLHSFGRELQTA